MKIFDVFAGHKPRYLLIALLLIFIGSPIFAQRKVTVKLASLVPENTAWGAAINRLAADWSRITNGEVEMIVYHNGTAGDEAAVLRKLKINQLQAAVFTSIGMNAIVPEVMAISYPFLIRNDAELEAVMNRLKPELNAKIQQQDFVTLAWANAGWIKVFSKTPVYVPDDLRKIRFGSNGDDERFVQAFKAMGYNIVPVSLTDVLVALNSNMVDSIYLSPVYAAGSQLFGVAKNMMSINLAPFMGGIVINNATWRKIPEKYRNQLLAVCSRLEKEVEASIINLETESISTMAKYGLVINELNQQQVQAWYDDVAKYENSLVGSNPVFNRDFYLKIKDILAEYRRGR